MSTPPFTPYQPPENPQAWWNRTVMDWLEWSGLTFTQWCRTTGVPIYVLESWRKDGCIPRDVERIGAMMEEWSGRGGITKSLRFAKVEAVKEKVRRTRAHVKKPQKYTTRVHT